MTLEQARNLTMLAADDLRCAGMRLQKAKAKGDANEVAETLAARDAARAAYDETVRVYAAAKKQSMRLWALEREAMAIFHRSRFGNFSSYFVSDIDGYVATSAKEARTLRWPDTLTREGACEIARRNRAAKRRAVSDLRAWSGYR